VSWTPDIIKAEKGDTRKRCPLCDAKIGEGDVCIWFANSEFRGKVSFRFAHLRCWMIGTNLPIPEELPKKIKKDRMVKEL